MAFIVFYLVFLVCYTVFYCCFFGFSCFSFKPAKSNFKLQPPRTSGFGFVEHFFRKNKQKQQKFTYII